MKEVATGSDDLGKPVAIEVADNDRASAWETPRGVLFWIDEEAFSEHWFTLARDDLHGAGSDLGGDRVAA